MAAVLLAVALSGCAKLTATTKDTSKALGVAVTHCSAYGPLKTTQGVKPGIKFGAAVVCEQ
jgi:hypothetical protein